jgi:hypothetical protein
MPPQGHCIHASPPQGHRAHASPGSTTSHPHHLNAIALTPLPAQRHRIHTTSTPLHTRVNAIASTPPQRQRTHASPGSTPSHPRLAICTQRVAPQRLLFVYSNFLLQYFYGFLNFILYFFNFVIDNF